MSSKRTERRIRLQLARSLSSEVSSPPYPKAPCVNESDDDNSVSLSSPLSSSDFPFFDLDNSADIHVSSSEFHCDSKMGSPDSLTITDFSSAGSSDGVCSESDGSESIFCSSSESQSEEGEGEDSNTASELKQIVEMKSVSSSPLIANVVIMSIMKKHHLTYACQADILSLLSILCPSPAIPSSVYTLNRHYVDFDKDAVVHLCCSACKALVTNALTPHCCGSPHIDSKFVEVPLNIQLADRFKGMKV